MNKDLQFELINCSSCGDKKKRALMGWAARTGKTTQRPVFVDEAGKKWNFNQCPDCRAAYSKGAKVTQLKRKCLKCGGPLSVNYFYHTTCLETVVDERGDNGEVQSMAKGPTGTWQAPKFSTG